MKKIGTGRRGTRTLLLFFALSTSVLSMARAGATDACPDLSGAFRCVGADEGKDLLFNVRKVAGSTEDESVYRMDYPGYDLHIEVRASAFGRKNQDAPGERVYWAYCMHDSLIYILENDTTGFIQESSILDGGYSVSVRGKSLGPPCERVSR